MLGKKKKTIVKIVLKLKNIVTPSGGRIKITFSARRRWYENAFKYYEWLLRRGDFIFLIADINYVSGILNPKYYAFRFVRHAV